MHINVFHLALYSAPKRAYAKQPKSLPHVRFPPRPFLLASLVISPLVENMAQTGAPEPNQHASKPEATPGSFAYGDNEAISDFEYEIQSSSDAFNYASSPEKRDRLLDELLKRKDSLFEAALACMLFKVHKVYTLTRYTR